MKLLTLVLALMLTGCASVGRKIDTAKLDQIKKGQSTKEDVVKLLGTPNSLTSDSEGNTTMAYIYSRATIKGQTLIPIAGAFIGGANAQCQIVMVMIGPDGKVSRFYQSQTVIESGPGLGSGGQANSPKFDAP